MDNEVIGSKGMDAAEFEIDRLQKLVATLSIEGRCRFNCRTGRMWYYAGLKKMSVFEIPADLMEAYYQEERRKMREGRRTDKTDSLRTSESQD